MCLIVFAWQPDGDYPLLLAANRDEFHARPSAPMAFWPDAPELLAGRDLEAGGTWLGVTASGRFAAVTNVRDPQAGERAAPRSRGDLTREFLAGEASPRDYLAAVSSRSDQYQGFNLLVGDRRALWYLHGDRNSDGAMPQRLAAGVYGLSNAALDVPWPKVTRARAALRALVEGGGAPDAEALRACVADRSLADADELAGEVLGADMARRLSAQFIVTENYGTRCCTTLVRHAGGTQWVTEQRFDAAGELRGEERFELAAD